MRLTLEIVDAVCFYPCDDFDRSSCQGGDGVDHSLYPDGGIVDHRLRQEGSIAVEACYQD